MTASASTERDRVTVTWSDGRTDEYPHLWLRDNCHCVECFDPDAGERQLDTVAVPPDIAPRTVAVDRGLTVEWGDGHRTALSETWLRDHAPGRHGDAAASVPVGWDAAVGAAPPEITFEEIDAGEEVLHGRTAFDPASGRRRLQGCYVDKDDALGRLRALETGHVGVTP